MRIKNSINQEFDFVVIAVHEKKKPIRKESNQRNAGFSMKLINS